MDHHIKDWTVPEFSDLTGGGNAVFDEAFDESPFGLGVVGLDGSRRRANAALRRMLGLDGDDYLTVSLEDLTGPDEVESERELIQSLLDGERSSYTSDRQFRHRDGTVTHGRVTVGLVRDEDGTPDHYLIQVEDRTETVQARGLLEAVVAQMSDQVVIIDDTGTVRWASPSFGRLTGHDPLGSNIADETHPDDRPSIAAAIRAIVDGSASSPTENLVRVWSAPLAAWRWIETTVTDHRADPAICGILLCGRDITQRIEQAAQLRSQAVHDPLTGLPNRALLFDRLERAATRARRYGLKFAVLFFDLDHFKDVNDTLGHAAGDTLLIEVANRIQSRLRSADTFARLGGDEFVIVLERLHPGSEIETTEQVCSTLLNQLTDPIDVGARHVRLTSSVGVVISDGDEAPEELLRAADVAMYAAKASGRARWVHHTEELTTSARDEFEVRERLTTALEHQDIRVQFQPIVEVATGRTYAVEALARLDDESGRPIPASLFIPVAERMGLIGTLGDQVLHHAARAVAPVPGLRLSVNVSGHQLADPDFDIRVIETLALTGLAPDRLVLEVTESVVVDTRDPLVVRTIHRIRDHGISFSLDDFGAGFSSLERLRNLPVSQLKIDRTFVSGMSTIGSGDIAVIRAVIGIAASLGTPIVAEGVETELQWQLIQRLGIEYAQGFFFGHPASTVSMAVAPEPSR